MPAKKKGADGYYRLNFSYDGKKYSVRSKNPKELNAKMRAKIKQMEAAAEAPAAAEISGDTSVKDWGEQWIKTYKTNVGRNSYERIEGMLKNHIYPHLGKVPIGKVKPIHLQQILNNLADSKATDTIKHVLQIVHGMFEQAVHNDLIEINPAKNLVLPKGRPAGSHRSITDRERKIILETCKTFDDALTIMLLLYTGMRPGEAIALTGADIHDGRIWISKAVEPRTQLIKEPKTKAGIRSVPIQKPLAEVLPDVAPFDYVIPQRRRNMTRDLIPNKHQTAQSLKGLWNKFLAAMEATEKQMIERGELAPFKEAVPPLRMYDLRHTYCSDLQRAGVPLNVARILMGHESVETTAKIYTHTDSDQLDDAATKMDSLYGFAGDDQTDDNKGLKRA